MNSRFSPIRFASLASLLSILCASCVQIVNPEPYNPEPTASFYSPAWLHDGSALYVVEDSEKTDGIESYTLKEFDRTGKAIRSNSLTLNLGNPIWMSSDGSTIYSNAGDLVQAYTIATGLSSSLSTDYIFAQSPGFSHFLLGSTAPSGSGYYDALTLMQFQNSTGRVQKQWLQQIPSPLSATWVSDSTFAIFRFNPNDNLVDLALFDTNLVVLDSFTITQYDNLNTGTLCYAAGHFYIAGYWGIVALDSASRQVTTITSDNIQNPTGYYYSQILPLMSAAPNGKFLVYTASTTSGDTTSYQIKAINTQTGKTTVIAGFPNLYYSSNYDYITAIYFQIAPTSDLLAYTDNSNRIGQMKVIPISAP